MQSSDEDDGNENVVRSRVSVKEASARFKDSVVDSTETGLSDFDEALLPLVELYNDALFAKISRIG